MPYQSFKELRVWQEAKGLAVTIYNITAKGKLAKDFGLKDQMQRAAVSIASNVAEGYERPGEKEFQRFLFIAKGSVSELRTQLEIAHETGFIPSEQFRKTDDTCDKISAMITKLMQARSKS